MRFRVAPALWVVLVDCSGSSPSDVCQQDVQLEEVQLAKVEGCAPDARDGGAADLDGGLQACEIAIRSCDGGDLAILSGAVECKQALQADVQCRWYTEPDPDADPSYFAYQEGLIGCGAKVSKIDSHVCAAALP